MDKFDSLIIQIFSPKLSVYIITNWLSCYVLIADDNDSLGGQEPENETDNFGRFSL